MQCVCVWRCRYLHQLDLVVVDVVVGPTVDHLGSNAFTQPGTQDRQALGVETQTHKRMRVTGESTLPWACSCWTPEWNPRRGEVAGRQLGVGLFHTRGNQPQAPGAVARGRMASPGRRSFTRSSSDVASRSSKISERSSISPASDPPCRLAIGLSPSTSKPSWGRKFGSPSAAAARAVGWG